MSQFRFQLSGVDPFIVVPQQLNLVVSQHFLLERYKVLVGLDL